MVSARVRVADVKVLPSFRRRVQRTIAVLTDSTGTIEATWFGRRYIERRLQVDQEVVVSGRVKWFGRKLTLDNPEFQAVQGDDEVLHAGRIVPVYRLTAGLTAARLRSAIRDALDRAGPTYPEYLPGRDPRRDGPARDRRDPRGRPLPADLRGPRRRAPPARLRRAAGAPARHGRPPPPAGARGRGRPIAIDDASDADVRAALTDALAVRVGRDVDASPTTRRRRPRRSGPTSPARPRCCGCSRATSARARPRSRRTRWPPSRGPASRARCSPRPTCWPASTSRPSGRCWRRSGSASRC